MKLTKIKIEEMANEIVDFLKKNEMIDSTCIYYNNKRIRNGILEEGEFNPRDYFEGSDKNILAMSFEGTLYDVMNCYSNYKTHDRITGKLKDIVKKYGCCYELYDSWNLNLYPDEIDYDDIEYTDCFVEREPDPIYIYDWNLDDIPGELKNIVIAWKEFQESIGESGTPVLGAGFKFKLNGIKYFMSPCSRFQGSISWETHKDIVGSMLENLGATEIYYDWGRMD